MLSPAASLLLSSYDAGEFCTITCLCLPLGGRHSGPGGTVGFAVEYPSDPAAASEIMRYLDMTFDAVQGASIDANLEEDLNSYLNLEFSNTHFVCFPGLSKNRYTATTLYQIQAHLLVLVHFVNLHMHKFHSDAKERKVQDKFTAITSQKWKPRWPKTLQQTTNEPVKYLQCRCYRNSGQDDPLSPEHHANEDEQASDHLCVEKYHEELRLGAFTFDNPAFIFRTSSKLETIHDINCLLRPTSEPPLQYVPVKLTFVELLHQKKYFMVQ
ncbi:hypothetical protein BJ508DRAFT_309370 [Ascobolus immersus RN42]|uniref:Uncharacterized protein n=1 Tax=Ascobolus immersus RN42 TaxID=1160509 RepID=A0A3N4HYS5_ASCIM|nr:hypothetical protein BJ508DRAFT_309370 [Ascobolus immersus RN42]